MIYRNCKTPDCNNTAVHQRTECHKCRHRHWFERNPIKYLFRNLKHNAKKRDKFFDLKLEEFSNLVLKTGYLELKGRSQNSLTIDRIKNDNGYSIDNIRVISKSKNCAKGIKEISCPF